MQNLTSIEKFQSDITSLGDIINKYFYLTNEFVNEVTSGLIEGPSFETIYKRGYNRIKRKRVSDDSEEVNSKNDLQNEIEATLERLAWNLDINRVQLEQRNQRKQGLYPEEIKKVLLTKITGDEIESKIARINKIYRLVGEQYHRLSSNIENLLSDSEPGRAAQFLSDQELAQIGASCDQCQYGNLVSSLKNRRRKLRHLDIDGTSLAVLENYLSSFENESKTIRDSINLLDFQYQILHSYSQPPLKVSNFDKLNEINSDKKEIKDRKFQFEPSFENEYKKAQPDIKNKAIKALLKLKAGMDLDALNSSTIRLHNLKDYKPMVWKMDVIRRRWQISLHINGNLFTLIFLKTHEDMDLIY